MKTVSKRIGSPVKWGKREGERIERRRRERGSIRTVGRKIGGLACEHDNSPEGSVNACHLSTACASQ